MITLKPVGWVRGGRSEPRDDDWAAERATIVLAEGFGPEALAGLDAFSHLEVVFAFHAADPGRTERGARHPRGNAAWPEVGIFAQRGKDRPNHLGVSRCRLDGVTGTELQVTGLDAIDGTPVLDLKPWMREFAPQESTHQPAWSHELMAGYWR